MITIDIQQKDVDVILAALKVAETTYTDEHEWTASSRISKVHNYLRKQIYGFVER